MAKRYFNNPETLEELRKQYKELLKKYHPDNGGSEDAAKAFHCEYEELFKVLKNRHERYVQLSAGVSPASSAQSAKRWVTNLFQQRVTIPC